MRITFDKVCSEEYTGSVQPPTDLAYPMEYRVAKKQSKRTSSGCSLRDDRVVPNPPQKLGSRSGSHLCASKYSGSKHRQCRIEKKSYSHPFWKTCALCPRRSSKLGEEGGIRSSAKACSSAHVAQAPSHLREPSPLGHGSIALARTFKCRSPRPNRKQLC